MESAMNKHRTVGKTFEIDQAAQKAFLSWIPNQWIPREDKPEFYLDYTVETTVDGEPTGFRFGVQLKGCESTNLHKYSMKAKHLLYFYEQCQLPVFIFRIRPETNEGYWVFAQKYVSEKLRMNVLRQCRTATIEFPRDNAISNFAKFLGELEQAQNFVRDLHPGSIEAALAAERKKLEAIEPRLDFQVDIINGARHVRLNPKAGEEFKFTVQIKNNPEANKAWKELIESGADLKLDSSSFEITGTQLFQPPKAGLRMELCFESNQKLPGYAQLVSTKAGRPAVVRIDGTCRGGTKRFSFDGEMTHGPLKLVFEAPFSSVLEKEPMTFNVSFNLPSWYGMQLSALPEYDQVFELYEAVEESDSIEIAFFANGLRFLNGKGSNFPKSELSWILGVLRLLGKARAIGQRIGLNPKIRGAQDFDSKHLDSVEEIQLHMQPTTRTILSESITLSSTVEMPYSAVVRQTKTGVPGKLEITHTARTVEFFDATVSLGLMKRDYSAAEIVKIDPVSEKRTSYVVRIPKGAEEVVSVERPPIVQRSK